MSKRTKNQLTKDDSILGRDDLSDRDEEMDPPQIASSKILAGRKIAGLGKRFTKKSNNINNNNINNTTDNLNSDQISQLKSLNANFLKSINDGLNKNPIANLNEICSKYLDYINKVLSKKIQVKNLNVPKVTINPNTIKTDDDSKPNPFAIFAKPIEPINNSTTPSFSSTTTTTTLKPEPIVTEKSKSDSESDDDGDKEIEIKGPTFKLDAKIKDDVFKFGKVQQKKKDNDSDDDSDDEIEIKGPTFKIDAKINDNVFKFPNTDLKSDNKKEETSKPKIQNDNNLNDKPKEKISFNFSNSNIKPDEISDSKPTFNFGNTLNKETTNPTSITNNAPKFSFGSSIASNISEKPSFSFGNPSPADTTTSKPSFSFGNPAPADTTTRKPSFSFGATSLPKVENSNSSENSKFSLNNNSTNKFPTFNFGQNSTTNGFSFGSTNSTSTSTSNSNSNPFNIGTPSTTSPDKPSLVFNFQASEPNDKKEENKNTNNEVEKNDENSESKDLETDTVKGNFQVVNLTEKVDIKTGEENEDVLCTKRSKISLFNTESKKYDVVGLGELKILKNKSNNKSRILVRSDGSLNVILNVLISKDLKYSIIGEKKNILSIPSLNLDGTLNTYIARVKTENDANDLLKAIQSCQK